MARTKKSAEETTAAETSTFSETETAESMTDKTRAAAAAPDAVDILKTGTDTAPDAAAENHTDAGVKRIYAGASIPGFKSGTAFTGDIPEKLDVPFVRDCCVTEDKFTAFIKQRNVTSSYAALCYRQSAEYAKALTR